MIINFKTKSGITLISLIITIIILLILSGITINLLIGPNSIITQTYSAKSTLAIATAKELIYLKVYDFYNQQTEKNTVDNTPIQQSILNILYNCTFHNLHETEILINKDSNRNQIIINYAKFTFL